ncbi:hypothetical protein GY45DRAFT_1438280 [Cubamyces sp. BRFM 1775]|nr:hypothetical protein GY45DRAFT_1438280 [Cubamyces sp. BRFM 1775]
MIAEDLSETFREPPSSQPYNLSEWQTSLRPRSQHEDLVNWQHPSYPVLESLREKEIKEAANAPAAHSARPSGSSDASLPPAILPSRRQANSAHAAYRSRNMLTFPETQGVQDAQQELVLKIGHMSEFVRERSKRKARKTAQREALRSGIATASAGAALQRRDTNEGIGQSSRVSSSKAKALLRSNHTDPTLASTSSGKHVAEDDPMDEDEPIVGPSKVAPRPSAMTPRLFDNEDENDGAPSTTPTPPPKHRNSTTASRSSSAPKGKSGQYSAFTESPTSLHQTSLSADASMSYAGMSFETDSASEPQPSPVIPSPVSLAVQQGEPEAVADGPPEPTFPPPASARPSPTLARPRSQVQPQASSSRLPPALSQSPALSKPYVMPSPTPGASQTRPARASQRPPPPLGMRPNRPGASRYSVPKEPSKSIGGFRVPSFKPPTGHGARTAPGFSSSPSVSRSNSGSSNGAAGREADAMQGVTSQVVPDPPHVAAISAPSRPPQVLEMSARRPEPGNAMDEGKEADSSYGDIPFDFDREALDEAMSAYDG